LGGGDHPGGRDPRGAAGAIGHDGNRVAGGELATELAEGGHGAAGRRAADGGVAEVGRHAGDEVAVAGPADQQHGAASAVVPEQGEQLAVPTGVHKGLAGGQELFVRGAVVDANAPGAGEEREGARQDSGEDGHPDADGARLAGLAGRGPAAKSGLH
jgi:hypothetical protein